MTHHLHAQAAIHVLRAARRALNQAAAAEALTLALDPADGLRSPIYGGRGGRGGHSDPIADALNAAVDRSSASAWLADRITDTLRWLARRLQIPSGGDPLGRIEAALPTLRPATCAELTRWLAELDARIRAHLGLLGDDFGTAEQLAARLSTAERPITAERIRDWARRSRTAGDRLHGLLPVVRTPGARTGNAWYRLTAAQHVLRLTAREKQQARSGVDNVAA